MEEIGLTVAAIHAHVLALQQHFLDRVAAAPIAGLETAPGSSPRWRIRAAATSSPSRRRGPRRCYRDLLARRIVTDVRGHRIRFGFGCYHAARDIDRAFERMSAPAET